MKATQTPLSFEISADLAADLEKLRKQAGGLSLSKVIEHAIDQFDYQKIKHKNSGERRQLSVRLDQTKRVNLSKLSKSEKVSVAYLIRMALEALLDSPDKAKTVSQLKADVGSQAASAAPTVGSKTTGTKAVKKKTAKKTPAKKATPKAPAKKVTAKKAPAKKVAAKKAPAKKVVGKPASAKKAPAKKAAVKKAVAVKAPAKKSAKKAVVKAPAVPKKAVAKKAVKKAAKKAAKKK